MFRFIKSSGLKPSPQLQTIFQWWVTFFPIRKRQAEMSHPEVRSKLWKHWTSLTGCSFYNRYYSHFKKILNSVPFPCLTLSSPYSSVFIVCTPGAFALYSSDSGRVFKVHFNLSMHLHPRKWGIYLCAILDECLFPSSLPFLSPRGSLPCKTQIQLY